MQEISTNCDSCDYNIYKSISDGFSTDAVSCGPGGGNCFYAELLSPLNTVDRTFHTSELRGATTAINGILNTLRLAPPDGLQLCFLRVPGGIMLAWVEQDGPTPSDGITPYSDPEDIKLAVGLAQPGIEAA
jgi:hypothetical protein